MSMADRDTQWSRVVRYLRDPLLLIDAATGRCVDGNPAAANLLRTSVETLRGCHLAEFAPRSQPDGTTSLAIIGTWAGLRADLTHVMPWTFQRATGEIASTELQIFAIPGAPDQCLRCLRISEQPGAPAGRGAAPLTDANHELLESVRQRSMFLSSVSHDLRSPLHTIIGFSELLIAGQVAPGTPEHHESLVDILDAGRRLLAQIDDILALAATEQGHVELHPEPVALDALVRDVCAAARPSGGVEAVRLDCEFDPALAEVTVDPLRLRQIVFNYVSNAYRFVPDGRPSMRGRGRWFRMMRNNSSRSATLSSARVAPASRAACSSTAVIAALTTTTTLCSVRSLPLSRRQYSMPSRSGMYTSSTIRSGGSVSTMRRAVSPSPATSNSTAAPGRSSRRTARR